MASSGGGSRARWLPPAILVACWLTALWIYSVAKNRDDDLVRQKTAVEARQVATVLEDRLEFNSRIIGRLARRWSLQSRPSRSQWEDDALLIAGQDSVWRALAWVNPDLSVRWVVPRSLLDHDIPSHMEASPVLSAALKRALEEEEVVVSGSVSGWNKHVVAIAASLPGRGVPSYIVGFLKVDELVSQSLSGTPPGTYGAILYEGPTTLYVQGTDPGSSSRWTQVENIEVRGLKWAVRVSPEPVELERLHSDLPVFILAFGVCTGVFLSLMVWLVQTARARTSEVSSINQDLEWEMIKREQVEKAMRESEARFRSVTESANEAIIIADEQGRIVFWNSAAEHMFGIPESMALQRPLQMITPERHRKAHQADIQRLVSGDSDMVGRAIEIEGLRADNTEIPLELSVSTWTFDGHRFYSGIMRDISHRRATEAQIRKINAYLEARVKERTAELKRSNEELQQFAYVASHDLQEPARVVASFTQLLAKRYGGRLGPEADEFIGFAVEGCTRMQDLINDLLAYCRVGTTASFGPVECEDALDQALANLRLAIVESGARVTWEKPLPVIHGDKSQIVQLFQNLIGNAIKFRGNAAPAIQITATHEEGIWTFSVRDNGIGMETRHLERIFIIFQRLHTREEYKGTGIGLAICKKIVERHEGRIWVESRPGEGSTFRFTLPPEPAQAPFIERSTWKEASV